MLLCPPRAHRHGVHGVHGAGPQSRKKDMMGKPRREAPLTQLGPADLFSGAMAQRIAQETERVGTLFRWPIMGGLDAGQEVVFLVGPEANKLVLRTNWEAFSHDDGWTPIISDIMGSGLLNQDNPAWARSRK